MMYPMMHCLQCHRAVARTKSTKKFCSNRCRVKHHRLRHGLPLHRHRFVHLDSFLCKHYDCPMFGTRAELRILAAGGCMGECVKE